LIIVSTLVACLKALTHGLPAALDLHWLHYQLPSVSDCQGLSVQTLSHCQHLIFLYQCNAAAYSQCCRDIEVLEYEEDGAADEGAEDKVAA
jgi:hypothetical protein